MSSAYRRGQHLTADWPVLDLGLRRPTSRESAGGSTSTVRSNRPIFWDFAAVQAQPQTRPVVRHPLRHHLVALRQSVGGARDAATCSPPASRATKRGSSCCIAMTATPPTWRWGILPPRTRCSRIAGRASRWSTSTAARCGWWCRISISGRAPNGCSASNS